MRFSVQSIRKKEQIMDGLEFDGLDDLVDGLENAVRPKKRTKRF